MDQKMKNDKYSAISEIFRTRMNYILTHFHSLRYSKCIYYSITL